jgi:gamma-glutamyltranspeptidase/glutathione hydrolase
MIAKHGVQWFYRGPFAQHVARWMGRNGGIITAMDFADYRPKPRDPLQSRYRGYSIIGFPPPSSGGIHVAQILNTLENFPFTQWRDKPHDRHHVLAEAMKLAFADRAYFLGDGDFVEVPRGLTDTTYARQLADQIRLDRVLDVATHGNPPQLSDSLLEGHTTHIAAADHFGNWVGITATVNTSFGSKIIVPGTGVVLNNEMDDFSIQPGVPNAFGLIGSQNNAIAPGKRPLSSMSPTIVLDPVGAPLFTLGAAGGPKIITQVAQVIVNRLDMLMDLEDAVAAPRLHHQWRPNQLFHEPGFSRGSIDHLKSLGHDLQESSSGGITQAIGRSTDGQLYGVFDPRVPGKASGY